MENIVIIDSPRKACEAVLAACQPFKYQTFALTVTSDNALINIHCLKLVDVNAGLVVNAVKEDRADGVIVIRFARGQRPKAIGLDLNSAELILRESRLNGFRFCDVIIFSGKTFYSFAKEKRERLNPQNRK